MDKTELVPVLVTTEYRGVFFGYAKREDLDETNINMLGVRNCIYWDSTVGGFLGLAEFGPGRGCRISARADGQVRKVSSVFHCTPAAVAAWEEAPCFKG